MIFLSNISELILIERSRQVDWRGDLRNAVSSILHGYSPYFFTHTWMSPVKVTICGGIPCPNTFNDVSFHVRFQVALSAGRLAWWSTRCSPARQLDCSIICDWVSFHMRLDQFSYEIGSVFIWDWIGGSIDRNTLIILECTNISDEHTCITNSGGVGRSIGVVIYEMLSGAPPFFSDHTPQLFEVINKGHFDRTHRSFCFCLPLFLQWPPPSRIRENQQSCPIFVLPLRLGLVSRVQGVVIYEMLSGAPPFFSDHTAVLFETISNGYDQ